MALPRLQLVAFPLLAGIVDLQNRGEIRLKLPKNSQISLYTLLGEFFRSSNKIILMFQ